MTKHCLLYFFLIIFLSACADKDTQSIRLSGEINGLADDTLYIYGADKMYDRMDTLVAKNGKFSATLTADTLVSAILLFPDGTEYPLYLDKGNKIQIKGSAAELSSLHISGNAPNDELTNFNRELKGPGTPSEKALEEKAEQFIKENPASLVSIYLLDKYFVQKPQPDLAYIKQLTDRMTGELKDRPYMEALLKRIEEEDKVTIGKTVPNFRLHNAEGKEINRSNLRDQYLLLQFWASWDTLSRENNALYRRIYKKERKNKSFTLIGISLDTDKRRWKEVIETDTLKWEQTCDFAGWNGETVRQFAVSTLPANLLISPAGKIEGKNLDETAIEAKLTEIEQKEKEKKEAERRRNRSGTPVRR